MSCTAQHGIGSSINFFLGAGIVLYVYKQTLISDIFDIKYFYIKNYILPGRIQENFLLIDI